MRLKSIYFLNWCGNVFMLAVWSVFISWSVSIFAIDLKQVVRLTIAESLEIKKLKEKAYSLDLLIKEKQGGFSPTMAINVYHQQTDQAKPVDIGKRESNYTMSLSQPLYKPGLWHDYREAVINARILGVQQRAMRENLTQETLLAVMDICRIRSRLVITENSLMLVGKTVDIQKQLLRSGYGSRFDLIEAEVEKARYQKESQELENQLSLKLFDLGNISATTWDKKEFPIIIEPDIELGRGMSPESVSNWIENAYQSNVQLLLIRMNQELNQISQARGYNNLKPQVNLTLSYYQAEEEAITRYRVDESSVKLSMSMAFSPVSSYYRVQRNDIEKNVLHIEVEKVKKDLTNRINLLLRSIKLKSEYAKTQKHLKRKQRMVVDMFRKGINQKHFPISRFLDSSRKYNESQQDLTQTFIDIWEDHIRLLHLSGTLNVDTLNQLANEFDRISDLAG